MADKTLSRNYNERKTWIYRMSLACDRTENAKGAKKGDDDDDDDDSIDRTAMVILSLRSCC